MGKIEQNIDKLAKQARENAKQIYEVYKSILHE